MLELSATYRQLCALSLEKLMDTAVPGMEVLVCSLMSCSATKPHLPGSPFGLPHGFPSAGSFRSNTWIRSLPRSQTCVVVSTVSEEGNRSQGREQGPGSRPGFAARVRGTQILPRTAREPRIPGRGATGRPRPGGRREERRGGG